jgi:hypothetical protein
MLPAFTRCVAPRPLQRRGGAFGPGRPAGQGWPATRGRLHDRPAWRGLSSRRAISRVPARHARALRDAPPATAGCRRAGRPGRSRAGPWRPDASPRTGTAGPRPCPAAARLGACAGAARSPAPAAAPGRVAATRSRTKILRFSGGSGLAGPGLACVPLRRPDSPAGMPGDPGQFWCLAGAGETGHAPRGGPGIPGVTLEGLPVPHLYALGPADWLIVRYVELTSGCL